MTTPLAAHVEQTIDDLAQIHQQHREHASGRVKFIARLARWLAQPFTVFVATLAILIWFAAAYRQGGGNIEDPAMAWLELAAAVSGLIVVLIILATQYHQDELDERRAQLTLQLALVADRKAGKVIALLEELRRDLPSVADRADRESEEMAAPADTQSVLSELDRRGDKHAASAEPSAADTP